MLIKSFICLCLYAYKSAARLAQLDKRRSAERVACVQPPLFEVRGGCTQATEGEAAGSSPGRTNTQGLWKTDEKVLPL